jgi:hypothetical protein
MNDLEKHNVTLNLLKQHVWGITAVAQAVAQIWVWAALIRFVTGEYGLSHYWFGFPLMVTCIASIFGVMILCIVKQAEVTVKRKYGVR